MATFSRMPNYDIRNDGAGPYAVFYCDSCGREFRSQPNVGTVIKQDLGKQALGGLLRKVPLVGSQLAENALGEDARYTMKLDGPQLQKAWEQVQTNFRECPTCSRIVCLSDFDAKSGFCNDDSPRHEEISESYGTQAGAALKGFANAFGLGDALKGVGEAVNKAAENSIATCPNCGTTAAAGIKFCPECGTAMVQPKVQTCAKCGSPTYGAKFCPNCGAPQEVKAAAAFCSNCGSETKGAKFCPNCGQKV